MNAKKMNKIKRELCEALDPSDALPYEIFIRILSFLDYPDLLECSAVSQNWLSCINDHMLWNRLCNRLWKDKVYVPKSIQEKRSSDPKEAFRESLLDSKRQYITEEELCEAVWNFRFKKAAGEDWIDNDPWWHGKTPSKSVFHPDGSSEIIRSPDFKNTFVNAPERKWRWVNSAAGRKGPKGSFMQVNNYPPYIFSRAKNWGFIMESCWVILTSFPMPPKGECLELEDEALQVTTDVMNEEAMSYNMGVQLPFLHNLGGHQHGNQLVLPAHLLQLLAQHGLIVLDASDDENSDREDEIEGDEVEMENQDADGEDAPAPETDENDNGDADN